MTDLSSPSACERCGKKNPAEIHTCTPTPSARLQALERATLRGKTHTLDSAMAVVEEVPWLLQRIQQLEKINDTEREAAEKVIEAGKTFRPRIEELEEKNKKLSDRVMYLQESIRIVNEREAAYQNLVNENAVLREEKRVAVEIINDAWDQFAYKSDAPSAIRGKYSSGLSTLERMEDIITQSHYE